MERHQRPTDAIPKHTGRNWNLVSEIEWIALHVFYPGLSFLHFNLHQEYQGEKILYIVYNRYQIAILISVLAMGQNINQEICEIVHNIIGDFTCLYNFGICIFCD